MSGDNQPSNPETVLIVPCFNEEQRLSLAEYSRFIDSNPRVSFVFVDDGSTDDTLAALQRLKGQYPNRADIVSMDRNLGKAEAVRHGVLLAKENSECELIGYWDADLSTPLTELDRFVKVMKRAQGYKFVSGARVLRMGSEIRRHWFRHYPGRFFATAVSAALGMPYYDTQCGAKVFRRECVDVLFGEPFLSRWIFDVELIFRLKNSVPAGDVNTVFYEVPLTSWHDVEGSKLSFSDYFKAPYELLKLWRRYG